MLTRSQRTLLIFICDYIKREKVAPSHDEMRVALGLHSKSGINRILGGLIERGYIRKIPYRARAFEVLHNPFDDKVGYSITPEEYKVICYLRQDRYTMAQLLEQCA